MPLTFRHRYGWLSGPLWLEKSAIGLSESQKASNIRDVVLTYLVDRFYERGSVGNRLLCIMPSNSRTSFSIRLSTLD